MLHWFPEYPGLQEQAPVTLLHVLLIVLVLLQLQIPRHSYPYVPFGHSIFNRKKVQKRQHCHSTCRKSCLAIEGFQSGDLYSRVTYFEGVAT